MTSNEAVRTSTSQGISEIVLSRPELLNRVDACLETELIAALSQAAADTSIRAVVLTAEGKAFCAGGDFEMILTANEQTAFRQVAMERARRLLGVLTSLPVPLIVGVQGAAMGLGATIALAADVVVASRNAKIADTHVSVGLVAGDGGALFWPQSAGMLRARRYLLTGDIINAETAYSFGLVTDLVESPDEVAGYAKGIARRIADLPPLAVRGTKKALNQLTKQRLGEVGETGLLVEEITLASTDLAEGIAAFKERRPGKYTGQ